jgi:integrase
MRGYKKPAAFFKIIPPPTAAEISLILDNASDHLRRAILLSYFLGVRPGPIELLSLTWLAVNFENDTIIVTSAHKGSPEKRVVPLHPGLVEKLKTWYKADKNKTGPIIHFRGRPVTDIRTAWRNALRRAGITRKLRFYDVRHGFATTALENHAHIKALSEIMGSSPSTLVKTYQHVSSQLRKETVSKIPGGLVVQYDQNKKRAEIPKRNSALLNCLKLLMVPKAGLEPARAWPTTPSR